MDFAASKHSDIAAFFANKTLLITGGTGFIGKLLVEKLLRACPDIRKIYLVIRPKKGVSPQKRLATLLAGKVFEGVINRRPEALNQVEALVGETSEPLLGLSEADLARIKLEVEIVIHSAATVKFNEPLSVATRVNIGSTIQMVALCRQMPKLCCLLHVSTAYVNVTEPSDVIVEERVYHSKLSGEDLLELIERLPPDALEAATPKLMLGFPNTYTITKKLAEQVVENSGLPAIIVRPSVVIATNKEPFPAWIDNMNGPTGFLLALGTGVLSVVRTKLSLKPDIVPADFVVNCIIAAVYREFGHILQRHLALNFRLGGTGVTDTQPGQMALRATNGFHLDTPVPVVHACMGHERNLPMFDFKGRCEKLVAEFPPLNCIRYQGAAVVETEWEFRLRIPMELADLFVCRLAGKQIAIRKMYHRLVDSLEMLGFFFLQDWNFETTNSKKLFDGLTETDQYLFPMMSTEEFCWDEFFMIYLSSIKYFVLNETLSQLEPARRWRRKLAIIHYATLLLSYFVLAKVLAKTIEFVVEVDIPLL